MELKSVALGESVATTSQPNKKRSYAEQRELQWQARLEELRVFRQTYGHSRVPYGYPQLGNWASNMRRELKKREKGKESYLTAQRIAALNNLGFVWAPFSYVDWKSRFRELREFRQIHGHCRVPQKYSQNPSLGKWVSKMRLEFKKVEEKQKSLLTAESIATLNNLGFDWFIGSTGRHTGLCNNTTWKLRSQELRDFHQTHGHCRVPQKYAQNLSLGHWVAKMRREFRNRENGQESSLTEERIATLNNLGFDWVVKNEAWRVRLQELRDFHQTHGHCRVPQKYAQNPSLGRWVCKMRLSAFKKWENGQESSLTEERIATLNNLGFDWGVKNEAWKLRLQELRDFHQTHGDCRVPQKYTQNPSLGHWVAKMRAEFKKRENGQGSSLTKERIAALNNLGFDWVAKRGYESVNDTTRKLELENIGLGSGSVQQTKTSAAFAERGTMELKRVALGESVATTSQPNKKRRFAEIQEFQWQTRLKELQGFHQIHGDCRVPGKYPQNPQLGNWVENLRREFTQGENGNHSSLTAEQIAALNNLGFDWVTGRGNGSVHDMTWWKLRLEELRGSEEIREFLQTHGHQQHHHVAPAVPLRDSEEGGVDSESYWV